MSVPDAGSPGGHPRAEAVGTMLHAQRREIIDRFNRVLSERQNGANDAELVMSLRSLQGLVLRICLELAHTDAASAAHGHQWFEIALMIEDLAGQAMRLAPALLLLRFRVLDHRLHACINAERFAAAKSVVTLRQERRDPTAVAPLLG